MGESTLVKLEFLTSLSLSLIFCTRTLLGWQCSEDAMRKMYLKHLALCQALSKCLKNRSSCSCRYFRLLNSSNKTIIILHWMEWKAKCGTVFQVTGQLGEGQGWDPIPGLPTPGLSFCHTPLAVRTHLVQRSSSRLPCGGPSTLPPKSYPCSLQNILQKCLLLSCLLVIVIAVPSRGFSSFRPQLTPLSFSLCLRRDPPSPPCWNNPTPISFLSFPPFLSSLWPV